MVFGWLVIGSFSWWKKERGTGYKVVFLVGAGFLGLLLAGMLEQSSSFIIVWFIGVLMMLVISSETVKIKLSNRRAAEFLGVLFVVSLAAAAFAAYATFAWTKQYYDLTLGVPLALCVFLGVLLLNNGGFKQISKLALNKHVAGLTTAGAAYSYTLFLTHYPIIILLAGLNLPTNRLLMLIPILLITNLIAYTLAYFTEKRHRQIACTIKRWLHLSQC